MSLGAWQCGIGSPAASVQRVVRQGWARIPFQSEKGDVAVGSKLLSGQIYYMSFYPSMYLFQSSNVKRRVFRSKSLGFVFTTSHICSA